MATIRQKVVKGTAIAGVLVATGLVAYGVTKASQAEVRALTSVMRADIDRIRSDINAYKRTESAKEKKLDAIIAKNNEEAKKDKPHRHGPERKKQLEELNSLRERFIRQEGQKAPIPEQKQEATTPGQKKANEALARAQENLRQVQKAAEAAENAKKAAEDLRNLDRAQAGKKQYGVVPGAPVPMRRDARPTVDPDEQARIEAYVNNVRNMRYQQDAYRWQVENYNNNGIPGGPGCLSATPVDGAQCAKAGWIILPDLDWPDRRILYNRYGYNPYTQPPFIRP